MTTKRVILEFDTSDADLREVLELLERKGIDLRAFLTKADPPDHSIAQAWVDSARVLNAYADAARLAKSGLIGKSVCLTLNFEGGASQP